ncbi:unnamed protein product [Mesocestoides corti]|uniref:tRNA-binding domain-containing protein n=2 Tax=Mesocestoides corti TaxID=53468 RepID=A0A0R3U3B1_MESCO|nr:unnamed protein product [Mesocestoides corti]
MTVEELATTVEQKIKLLANADAKAIERAEHAYIRANAQLREVISGLKTSLINLELLAGEQQDPPHTASAPTKTAKQPTPVKAEKKGGKPADSNSSVDVSRLDMRVGKIEEVERHPDADSLYVEKVDLGEGHLRTIISGLVNNVPIEKMQGLVGIFMCNLKPVKMRGILSEGMLMCATDANQKVEPLVIVSDTPPKLGDTVYVDGYPGEPDDQLNPKKKIFEQVKPDLRVDGNHLATYKGTPWKLKGDPSAVIKAPTVVDAQIS